MVDPTAAASIITNGTITGVLPATLTFAINYPGYPTSLSRAIDTIGGSKELEKVRSTEQGKLELRFRPEDPYCHPTYGERRTYTGLVLKLSKSESGLSGGIIARVNEAYDFNGMVDYQYVPAVHAAEARRKKRRCPFDEENDLEEETEVMMLAPPLFSHKNIPEEIVLNPPPVLASKNLQKNVVVHRWEMDVEDCYRISFTVENVPKYFNWKEYIPTDSAEWKWQSAISKLFEERPIWPRRSLLEQLIDNGVPVTDHMIRRLLFRSGYYFSTGPFARFWIRKGYDPRKDPESRKYQKIDFRVPAQLRTVYANIDDNRSLKYKWKDICHFQVFPWKNFISLQFCELDDDFIQKEIQKPPSESTCMLNSGWFSEHLIKTLRLQVKLRFLQVCPSESAKIVLRAVREKFEKCKKKEALIRTGQFLKMNQASDMSVPAADIGSAIPENQVSDNEEEEEEEVDEEEEEEDIFGSQAKTAEDVDFSLDPTTFQTADNMANDYLQDLLSEFPFCKDGKNFNLGNEYQNAESSDGEFQIYDQDSDENSDADEDDYS